MSSLSTSEIHYRSAAAATAGGLCACTIWSAAVIVSGKLAATLGGTTAASLELLLGGCILLVLTQRARQKSQFHSPTFYIVSGIFWLLNITCFWMAVAAVDHEKQLLVVGLINYLWPALTFLGAVVLFHRKHSPILYLGLVLALSGIIIARVHLSGLSYLDGVTTIVGDVNAGAYLLALIGAVSWALYSNLSKRLANPAGGNPVVYFMPMGGLLLGIYSCLSHEKTTWSLNIFLLLIAWSILSCCAYMLWDKAMRLGNTIIVSAASMVTPLVSTVLTAVITGETLHSNIVLAGSLVVGGAYLAQRSVLD